MTMKSIMEEASSIAKAVEKCWQRAGNPIEFKIKIFEQPTYNFLGFCIKKAKVAIFYMLENPDFENKDKSVSKSPQKKSTIRELTQPQSNKQPRPKQDTVKNNPIPQQTQEMSAKALPQWSNEMVNAVSDWVNGTLEILKSSSTATYVVTNNYLKITFTNPITSNSQKERQLYRSFAYLVMAGMRNKFKFEFRNLKLVISNEKNSSESR